MLGKRSNDGGRSNHLLAIEAPGLFIPLLGLQAVPCDSGAEAGRLAGDTDGKNQFGLSQHCLVLQSISSSDAVIIVPAA